MTYDHLKTDNLTDKELQDLGVSLETAMMILCASKDAQKVEDCCQCPFNRFCTKIDLYRKDIVVEQDIRWYTDRPWSENAEDNITPEDHNDSQL